MAIIIFGQKFFGYQSVGKAVSLGQDIKKWRIVWNMPTVIGDSDMGCTPGNKDAFMWTKTSKHEPTIKVCF